MYDPLETDLSHKELTAIFKESVGIPICLIGGWASYFYVNEKYKRAFGKEYMGSRDIDIFFEPKKEKEFLKVINKRGFTKNGFHFRYEKIYDRESKLFITLEQAKRKQLYNLIYIFLDLFSNEETKLLGSWWDLEPLKKISSVKIDDFFVADIDTLIALKCTAIFARDKADKENKDACDLYALMTYSGRPIILTRLLQKAIEKILSRPDLLYAVAEHVILDPSKQSIVEVTLRDKLKEINT
ncbi:nucleotidyl transferase AbiEii/AbiGii toxin family protein [Candidatus Woesearchaeota archaeon]|nr:nucleotidyl transferase AbiEii/AbiGii toxin family protein [Candidatus Woesearchaeota archaeon]